MDTAGTGRGHTYTLRPPARPIFFMSNMAEMNFADEDFQKTLCVQGTDREPEFFDDDHGYGPTWLCDCGHYDCAPYSFCIDIPSGEIVLCSTCVLAAANRYWERSGAGYLTWTKPIRVDPHKRKSISKIRKKIFERDAYRCRYCGSYLNLVIDHVIPHIRTQDDSEENLATACRKCNGKKKDRTPEEAGMILLPVPATEAA